VTGLMIVIRFAHLGALTLLIGAFAFLLLIARPAFKKWGGEQSTDFRGFDDLMARLAGWSVVITCVSALAWLWVQTAIITGRPLTEGLDINAIWSVLTRTQFGAIWQLRLGLVTLLGGLLVFRDREPHGWDWLALRFEGLLLGASLTIALVGAGHAAATQGPALFGHLVADAVHLLATGVWLGGLVPLALLLTQARRRLDALWAGVARAATIRFSVLGLISVATLAVTGIVNALMLVGGVPQLVGTPYGGLLLLKLSLLLPLVAIAAVNLLRIKPQLLAALPAGSEDALAQLLHRLRRNVIGESCLGAAILLIVGALGITAPARHILQPSWPFPFRLNVEISRASSATWVPLGMASLGIVLGIAVVSYGIFRRRHRPWAIAVGLVLVAGLGVLPLRTFAVDAYPTTYHRPAVRYHAISVANGARLYEQHCAVCHGVSGYGDGPAAASLNRRPADLTAKHTTDHTAGDLFWWLTHGIRGSPMPGFKDLLDEEERWDVINFLRALSAAEQGRTMGPLVDPDPWFVAPDFSFGVGVGQGATLNEHRGRTIIHLVFFTLPGSLSRLEQLDGSWGQTRPTGARVLAVPMLEPTQIYRKLGMRAANLSVVIDGSQEIVETYTLFRRTLAFEGLPPIFPHMEFLIDRQGYIRARWIPGEGQGWAEIPRLLKEVERLATEAPRAPAPEEHVH